MVLHLAWDNNIPELVAEIDSKVVFEWVSRHMDCNHKYAALLRECHLLLRRNWEVQLHLIFREGNMVADCLAKRALEFHNGKYFV